MAEYTYQTRRKLSEEWVGQVREKGKGKDLSNMEKKLLPETSYYSMSTEACDWIRELLENGTYRRLSDVYREQLPGLTAACVPEGK